MARWLASLVMALGLLVGTTAWAAVPKVVPLHGILRSVGGGPVADGVYIATLKLYPDKDAKDAFFKEIHFNVQVAGGIFQMMLGSVEPAANPLPLDKIAAGNVWLGLAVDSEVELPRQQLASTPFALVAGHADSAAALQCSGCVATGQLADGAVTADKIAAGAVQASKVGFAYAGSSEKGGVATSAAGLQCTGCVKAEQLADASVTPAKLVQGAVGAKQLADESVGTAHLQSGAVGLAHIAKAAQDALHDWKGLLNVPTGFADGVDDTMTVDGLKAALKGNAVDLADKSSVAGAPIARMFSASKDDLADKGTLELDAGGGSPILVAQAWFADKDGQWFLADAGAVGGLAGGCTDCGSGKDGAYNATSSGNLAGGTYEFTNFTIGKGVTITVTGDKPLIVLCTGAISIQGALLANGSKGTDVAQNYGGGPFSGGAAGPGGHAGGTGYYGQSGESGKGPGGGGGAPSTGYAGGGGGAGFGSGGANGTAGSSGTFGNGGGTYSDAQLGTFIGGSGGGAGGYGSGINAGGAGGGGGGGAIKLVGNSISISGTVQANGGAGGSQLSNGDGGGGGGGSGGAVWLRGLTIDIAGTVQALGGNGGSKGSSSGPGGKGGDGRIRVDANTISGASSPTYAKGATTGLEKPLVNAFSITQPKPGVVRLTNLSGSVQKVRLVVMR